VHVPTIQSLTDDLERQRVIAQRSFSDAETKIGRLLKVGVAEGRKNLTADEETELDRLTGLKRSADDDVKRLEGKLEQAREIAAESAEHMAAAQDTRSTGVRLPTSRDGEYTLGGGVNVGPGSVFASSGDVAGFQFRPDRGSTAPMWVRTNDMRPATVARGEPFAEHEIVREHAQRQHAADQAVTGQHGSFGQMVRAMTTTSGSAVVPTLWAGDIIDRARNLSAVMSAGAEVVPMDSKVVNIGRLTTDPTAAFRAEGSTVVASDPVFDNVVLTATTLSALVVGSMEWFMDADNVDQVVSEAIAKAIATQIDLVALFGQITTGHEQDASPGNNLLPVGGLPSPNPRGILATLLAVASSSVLGAQTNGTVQTAATFWGEVIDSIYTVRDFNEAPNALIWPSRLARIYARAADTTNQPLRQPPDVEQITKFVSNQIPSGMTQGTGTLMSDLFVGDFTQLLIGQRLGLTVQTLVERYAELGQVAIVAHWRGDVQLARPRAFSVFRYLKGV
jgi:HK97 family phage major capsid protein